MRRTQCSTKTSSMTGKKSWRNIPQFVPLNFLSAVSSRIVLSFQGNGIKIEKFELCDFRPIFEYHEAEKAKKKALSAAEKKALKTERDKAEEKYTFCLLDGRKEKVGNFRIEPPGLFRGRGDHPRKGALKVRACLYHD